MQARLGWGLGLGLGLEPVGRARARVTITMCIKFSGCWAGMAQWASVSQCHRFESGSVYTISFHSPKFCDFNCWLFNQMR